MGLVNFLLHCNASNLVLEILEHDKIWREFAIASHPKLWRTRPRE